MENVIELKPEQIMDENQRIQECYNFISAALNKYGCKLDCSAIIKSDGKIDFDVKVQIKKGE